MKSERQHAHQLLDQLAPGQLDVIVRLLEVMIDANGAEEALTEEDRRAVAASREWFKRNPEGISIEQVAADCGITMDEIRKSNGD